MAYEGYSEFLDNLYIFSIWMNLALYGVFFLISFIVIVSIYGKPKDPSAVVTLVFYQVKMFLQFLLWFIFYIYQFQTGRDTPRG